MFGGFIFLIETKVQESFSLEWDACACMHLCTADFTHLVVVLYQMFKC